jgi:hypothetical protein
LEVEEQLGSFFTIRSKGKTALVVALEMISKELLQYGLPPPTTPLSP